MRFYDARFLHRSGDEVRRITVRVVRRKHAEHLLPGWTWQPLGPLAIGCHVADVRTPVQSGRFTIN
jgi:hypothetical protein